MIFKPALYRRYLDYVNEMLGPAWAVLYGLLFSFCAIFIAVSIIFSGVSFLYIFPGTAMGVISVFCVLSGTEQYSRLAKLWAALSDLQLRFAGVLFLILAVTVCYVAVKVYFDF